jgi:hypothetical protein
VKGRGLLVVLILAMGIIYLIWFSKTGGKNRLEEKVDRYVQAEADLTRANMQALQKIVIAYMSSEGRSPRSLQDLRNFNALVGGALDAWGTSIRYERISDESFRLVSAGKDRLFGTADDIILDY